MITMEKLGRLRRLYFRDGLSLSEIARKTGFARNTVKAWLKAVEGIEPKYRRRESQTKISPFTELLTKALETDARRPKRDRRSALKLYAVLFARRGLTRPRDRIDHSDATTNA